MICSTQRQLELAMRSAVAEATYRHYARKDYLERTDCTGDDSSLAFAEQAVAEAEMRSTQARFALDEHRFFCPFCSEANLS
jgi:hypothetical protein